MFDSKPVVITGGAGLVGQNLIHTLKQNGCKHIVSIDRHAANNRVLRELHPDITVIDADVAEAGPWQNTFDGAGALVMLQAQISGLNYSEFEHNTVFSTESILRAAERFNVPYMVHVSSSVVSSLADDFYTRSKREQEDIVKRCKIKHCVLRPTLMFGWFDRKHLGWLARFMKRSPVFPVPGDGQYIRQPLFELDFCAIILACLQNRTEGSFNISGRERITYIDMIRQIKTVTGARAKIVKIPYSLFAFLLRFYALFDRNPPFTAQQLAALVIPEEFEIIDWPKIFGVPMTPWQVALKRTFQEKPYCDIFLDF